MTARERMREAEASCDHVDKGICQDCCARAIRIHAEEVREEAARTLEITQMRLPEPFRKCDFFPDEDQDGWVNIPRQIQEILGTAAKRIRAIEVQ